jgi:hypothetical protein
MSEYDEKNFELKKKLDEIKNNKKTSNDDAVLEQKNKKWLLMNSNKKNVQSKDDIDLLFNSKNSKNFKNKNSNDAPAFFAWGI